MWTNGWTPFMRAALKGKAPLGAVFRGPTEQEIPLPGVSSETCGSLELRTGFAAASQLRQEVAANGGEEVIGRERGLLEEPVHDFETRRRAERHGDRDGAVQLD